MFKTRVTEMLNLKYPIFCGNMMNISYPEFTAACSNTGALHFTLSDNIYFLEFLILST